MKEQRHKVEYRSPRASYPVEDGTKRFQWEMETLLNTAQSNEGGEQYPDFSCIVSSILPKLPILGQQQPEDLAKLTEKCS